jgi:hypothetical protein
MDLSNIDLGDLQALEGLLNGGGGDDGGLAALGEASGSGDGGATGNDNAGTTAAADDTGGDLNLDAARWRRPHCPPVPEPPAPVEQSSQQAPAPAPSPSSRRCQTLFLRRHNRPQTPLRNHLDDTNLGDQGGLGDINFDDFNFDDQMPQVDGDEFASLFAEFK